MTIKEKQREFWKHGLNPITGWPPVKPIEFNGLGLNSAQYALLKNSKYKTK